MCNLPAQAGDRGPERSATIDEKLTVWRRNYAPYSGMLSGYEPARSNAAFSPLAKLMASP
jgi:hypothetical protein